MINSFPTFTAVSRVSAFFEEVPSPRVGGIPLFGLLHMCSSKGYGRFFYPFWLFIGYRFWPFWSLIGYDQFFHSILNWLY